MGVVVLAVVLLHHIEKPAAAEGVAVGVDETACGSGILKSVALVVHEQFGLADGRLRVFPHLGYDRLNPARGYLHIVIQ